LLEAAAMGRPLIATDVPGCRQVVDEGMNGFLAEVRDARSLADAMLRMVRLGDAERAAMGAAGRAKMERDFDEKLVVARYLQAVEDAVR
jgi:glycosyltransferase involved in cell wall biosynthesis